jgi:H+-translocating NAD(P) transhydrogenase subunit alpha
MKIAKQALLFAGLTLAASLALAADPAGDAELRNLGLLGFVFVMATFLGFELINKVPSKLHTPLMSASNAISGITIVGALLAAGLDDGYVLTTVLGVVAVAAAMINVVGGYLVTDRMLAMFKKKDGGSR